MDDVVSVLIIVGFIILIPVYFIPTIVAVKRKCWKRGAIILINIFLGLTGLGWFGSLIWSIAGKTEEDVERQYQEDLVRYNMLVQQQNYAQQQVISQQIILSQGNKEYLYKSALKYEMGEGVQNDNYIAFQLMLAAANAGSSEANFKLGTYYEQGIGVTSDIEVAKTYYEKAKEQNNII